jgi:hypothetical protein
MESGAPELLLQRGVQIVGSEQHPADGVDDLLLVEVFAEERVSEDEVVSAGRLAVLYEDEMSEDVVVTVEGHELVQFGLILHLLQHRDVAQDEENLGVPLPILSGRMNARAEPLRTEKAESETSSTWSNASVRYVSSLW